MRNLNKRTKAKPKPKPTLILHHHHHYRFTALFPEPPGWACARRELLAFMVQGKINRGSHTDHPTGHHSIWTNQCPPPSSPHIFYRLDALPTTQPTASKHWRQQHWSLRNAHISMHITVHNCHTQHSTEQFW